MGSLSAKNAIEKFSCLGTFKSKIKRIDGHLSAALQNKNMNSNLFTKAQIKIWMAPLKCKIK
jgi:hypothetical protein